MDALWLWVGFGIGLLVRWGDRAQYIVSEVAERSWGGYFKANWMRLIIRLATTAYIFRLIMEQGWVTSEFIAFSVGISFDTLAESILDRAKKMGEATVQKFKNGKPPEPPPVT